MIGIIALAAAAYGAGMFTVALCKTAKQEPHPDTERLNFLIDQGPPGATSGMGLDDYAWQAAYQHVDTDDSTDRLCVRRAIDAQMAE